MAYESLGICSADFRQCIWWFNHTIYNFYNFITTTKQILSSIVKDEEILEIGFTF